MKCKVCDGSGITKGYDAILGNFFDMKCFACDGSGEVDHYEEEKEEPLTNEEWIDRKSTKEKAEWLFKLTYKCYWCGREYTPRSPSLYNEKECPFKKCMKDKKDFEKWLKQPHREGDVK